MPSLLSLVLDGFSWKSFAIGAGAALFGGMVARPALAQAVRVGMDVQDYATATVAQARAEYERAKDTAIAQRNAASQATVNIDLLAEIHKLHDEIASLRGAINAKKSQS
jgi:hypothetical protein